MLQYLRNLAGALLAILLVASPAASRADGEVDLALVLAVDVSNSMDPDEQALQREGFVGAFRSAVVHDAIRRGAIGRIAVTYMEWAGAFDQKVAVPWTVLDSPQSAMAFAERLAAVPIRRAPRTSISGAIDFSVKLFGESGVSALRRVIDVSGDGPNNQGRPVIMARDEAVRQGVTINGLPIMLKRPVSYFDASELDLYYRDCVIAGQGAFMVPVRERDQFLHAVKTKIVLEIAGRVPDRKLVEPAQASARAADCLAGEWRSRDLMGN